PIVLSRGPARQPRRDAAAPTAPEVTRRGPARAAAAQALATSRRQAYALEMSRLRDVVDGRPLPEDEARALWQRFSAHMDENRGDFEGFARAEGYAAASVAVAGSTPTLNLRSEGASPAGERASERRPRRKKRSGR